MQSCRELKKYISEGRRIVREIESETFEENPPLFREYMSATPDFKMLMDNQFKNVKTHARLLSKAMWYEWRMKLQDGLKEGLVKISQEMDDDDESLKRQMELLDSVLPGVLSRHETLSKEHANLQTYAEELAECDPEELQGARDELVGVEGDIEAKKKAIAELRSELQETESELEQVSAKKQECLDDIKGAEKIREECRGWSTTEINLHKGMFAHVFHEKNLARTTCNQGTWLTLICNSAGRSPRERARLVSNRCVAHAGVPCLQARHRGRLRRGVLPTQPARVAHRRVAHRHQPRRQRTARHARARVLPAADPRLCEGSAAESNQGQRHAEHGADGMGFSREGGKGCAGCQCYIPDQGCEDVGLFHCGGVEHHGSSPVDEGGGLA